MKRILGLDFGGKTVGVAVSDPLGLTAQGVEVIRRERENKLRQTLARIEALARSYDAACIVVGLPKLMSGESGERVNKTKEFADQLARRTKLPVILWDERLSTVAAKRALDEMGRSRDEQKQVIDEVAACLILQNYLDGIGRKIEERTD